MAGEGGSKIPMAIGVFSQTVTASLSNFMFKLETNDMKENQIMIGKFFGANPDLLLEPLVLLRSYTKMRSDLKGAAADVGDNALYAAEKQRAARQAETLDSKVDNAIANKTDPAKALKAGDELSFPLLRKIYGVSKKKHRRSSRNCPRIWMRYNISFTKSTLTRLTYKSRGLAKTAAAQV